MQLRKRTAECASVHQDRTINPSAETRAFAVWLRSPDGRPRTGSVVIWQGIDSLEEHGVNNAEKSVADFNIVGEKWQCIEASIVIDNPAYTVMRSEVYLDGAEGADLWLDNASFHDGPPSVCPRQGVELRDPGFEFDDELDAWHWLGQPGDCEFTARGNGAEAVEGARVLAVLVDNAQLAFWISDQPNGSHIGPIVRRPIPHLEPGASTQPMRADVQLDLGLNPEKDYFIVFDLYADTPASDQDRTLRRDSRPIDILPCEPDMLFCDVPMHHWARAEIEAWHENGITKGCNSAGVPFESLTFCPELSVERWMFSVFFQRHKYGSDYRPAGPYEQLFADATADLPFVIWVEDAAKDGLVLDSTQCAPDDAQFYFCPLASLRRIDLLRALSSLEQFDLATVEGSRYGDLATGSAEAKMADYLWHQGFLFAQDLFCPQREGAPHFCPEAPVRRAEVAYIMARAFGMVDAP